MEIKYFLILCLLIEKTVQSGAESENIEFLMLFIIFGVFIGLALLGIKKKT